MGISQPGPGLGPGPNGLKYTGPAHQLLLAKPPRLYSLVDKIREGVG
jgi:hypothetical protein